MKQETLTTTAPIATAMHNYAQYNLWANTTLVNWLKTKPEALLEQEVLSSFKSIKATLVHIWHTQAYWLSVISRTDFVPAPFTGSVPDIFEAILSQSLTLSDTVQNLSQEGLQDNVLVTNKWFECNFPVFEYVMQVMNHSTYHRGQIVTMGHHLGFTDAPMTDYNYFKVTV